MRTLSRRRSETFLGERDGVGGRWIVGNGCGPLAIGLDSLIPLAEFLVSLAQQALDEGVVLIRLEQFFHRGLVVLPIKRNIAAEIREKLRLLGNGAFVEDGFGSGDVVLRFGQVSATRRESGLRVLPAKVPQIHASRLNVGFFQSSVVAHLVPMEGRIQVAGVDASASGFVSNFSLLTKPLALASTPATWIRPSIGTRWATTLD